MQHSDTDTAAQTLTAAQAKPTQAIGNSATTSPCSESHTKVVIVRLLTEDAQPSPSSSLSESAPHVSYLELLSSDLSKIAQSTTTIPALSQSRTRARSLPRRSTYPRPSPPGFLYPEPIVPRSVYENATQHLSQGNVFPYSFEAICFATVAVAFAWATLVMLIQFPPRTWRFFACSDATKTSGAKEGNRWTRLAFWRTRSQAQDTKQERRPIDKPSKHPPPPSTPSIHLPTTHQRPSASGTNLTPRRDNTYTACRRTTSSTSLRFAPPSTQPSPTTPTPAPIPSPPNPFLAPPPCTPPENQIPLHHRTSTEWTTLHTAFFSTSAPASPAMSVTHLDPADMDDADIEALEAGTHTPKKEKSERDLGLGSWVDLSRERVGGAVNGFVGRVARFTDDVGGGELEGLVLPVSNGGRRGVKVE